MRLILRILGWTLVVLLALAAIVWVLPVVAALCIWYGIYRGVISGYRR